MNRSGLYVHRENNSCMFAKLIIELWNVCITAGINPLPVCSVMLAYLGGGLDHFGVQHGLQRLLHSCQSALPDGQLQPPDSAVTALQSGLPCG